MTPSQPVVGRPQDVPVAVPGPRRERVARRRRSHDRRKGTREWTARRSRRRVIRAVVVSAAMLVLMAIGLYLGLARQDASPGQGTRIVRPRAIG